MASSSRYFACAVFALSLAHSGCATEPIEDIASNEPAMSWEEFRDSTYREPWPGGMYIVDYDTPLASLKELRDFYDRLFPQPGALIIDMKNGAHNKQSDTQKRKLTYCISNGFGSNKAKVVRALKAATEDWEAAADVNFIYLSTQDAACTASNTNVYFDVRPVEASYLARAFFPHQARNSRNLLISSDAFTQTVWPLRGILGHELGHTLGFRHEHTRPEAGTCFEDNNWAALTPYDQASIMHAPQCNGVDNPPTMTELDRQGAALIYGVPGQPDPDEPTFSDTDTVTGSVSHGQFKQIGAVPVKPGTTFRVVMTGAGDPDLYVRFGEPPSQTQYSCRPFLEGANETCTLTVPANATSAHTAVKGYTAASFTITREWTAP